MTVVPCAQGADFDKKVQEIAQLLRTKAHELGDHGISETEFYDSGYFRAAIESIRGSFAASMGEKKAFMRGVLAHMQDEGLIGVWDHAQNKDRHDYSIPVGNLNVIVEQKGCLDGNNVNISERPNSADEFYIWSLCTNPGSDLGRGIWSAIMRITADMMATGKRVDGLIVWDMLCPSAQRMCPKLAANPERITEIGALRLPPPCIYLLPETIGNIESNPNPQAREPGTLGFVNALQKSFNGSSSDINYVAYDLRSTQSGAQRKVRLIRNGEIQKTSNWVSSRRIGY